MRVRKFGLSRFVCMAVAGLTPAVTPFVASNVGMCHSEKSVFRELSSRHRILVI